jgi:hypothetical protein
MRYIINNAEGDAPAAVVAPAAKTPAPVVQKVGAMDMVKNIVTNKSVLTGTALGAGLGFAAAWLSGANKIASTIIGASIFGFAGYAMGGEVKMGADGKSSSRTPAQPTGRPSFPHQSEGRPSGGGQSAPRPVHGGQSQGRPAYGQQSFPRPFHKKK